MSVSYLRNSFSLVFSLVSAKNAAIFKNRLIGSKFLIAPALTNLIDLDHMIHSRLSQIGKLNDNSFFPIHIFSTENLLSMRDILAKWRTWPRESSSEDAALGLIRIGHAYSLYPAPSTSLNSTQIPNLRLFAKSDRQCNLTKVSKNRPPLSFGYFSNHRCHAHDKHAPLAESVENNSDNLDLFRFLHNKDFHHSIAWLPLPIENNSSDNSSEQTRARVDPTSESQTRSYSYNFLSSRDLRFIAQVARDNRYCEESKTWAALAQFTASTSESQTGTGDFASIDPSTTSERDQKPSSLYEMFSDECPEPKGNHRKKKKPQPFYTRIDKST